MKRQLSNVSDDERPKKVQKTSAGQSASGTDENQDQDNRLVNSQLIFN